MKTVYRFGLPLFFAFLTMLNTSIYGQAPTWHDGVPPDLATSKLIFVKFDSSEHPVSYPPDVHLKNVPLSNAQALDAMQDYPFEYILAYRSELKELKKEGYKYRLFFEPSEPGFDRHRQEIDEKGRPFPLCIKDLESGDCWKICDITEGFGYYSKGLVNKLVKEVRKQYKLK